MVQAAIDLTGDFHAAVTALRKAGVGRAVRALPRDDAAAAGTTPGVGLGVRHRHSPGRPGVADTAGDAPSSSRFTAAVALVAKDIAAASMKLGNLTRRMCCVYRGWRWCCYCQVVHLPPSLQL